MQKILLAFFLALCAAEQRSVAVLRLSMAQGTHRTVTYSKSQIEQQIFHAPASLAKLFNLCSAGSLTITNKGVHDITVPGSYSTYPAPADLRNAGLVEFKRIKGIDADKFADHIIAMVPGPNPYQNFVGNAGTNHFLSTLNNQWSLDVMVYMHEFGHNLGLGHSTLSGGGGDFSSMMSATGWAPDLTGPLKCFNAPDNNRLGWFDHRKAVINVFSTPAVLVKVAAFSEWELGGSLPLLATIGKFSLQYNRATRHNSGTEMLRNQVAIGFIKTNQQSEIHREGLAPNGIVFQETNFEGSGKTLKVQACKALSGSPAVMEVGITLGKSGSPCSSNLIPFMPPSGPVEWRVRRVPVADRWTLSEIEFHSNSACTSKIALNGQPIEWSNTGKSGLVFDGVISGVKFYKVGTLDTWIGYKFTTAPNVKCVKVHSARCSVVVEAKKNGQWVEMAAGSVPRDAAGIIAVSALHDDAQDESATHSWKGPILVLGAVAVVVAGATLLRSKKATTVQEPLL